MRSRPGQFCAIVSARARTIALASIDGSPLACLIDGEPAECPSPFRFTVEPCGVDLLATAHDL